MPKQLPSTELNKAQAFVIAYVENGFNATDAARAVSKSENEHSLAQIGYEYMNKPVVQNLLQERLREARLSRDDMIDIISGKIRDGNVTTNDLVKLAQIHEKYTKDKAAAEQFEYEQKLRGLLQTGDILEDFLEGKTDKFEKMFKPRLNKDGKIIFGGLKKKRSFPVRDRQFRTLLKTLTEQGVISNLAAALFYLRWRCRNDMYYLGTKILGYRGERVDPKFHGWFCKELQDDAFLFNLYLLPRDHTKSTWGIEVRVTWSILKYPNRARLLGSLTQGMSETRLGIIKYHLSNPTITTLFPDIVWEQPELEAKRNRKIKWTRTEIRVKREVVRIDETVEVAGLGKNITGKHYDEIYLDDVINETNVATEDQREKVITWWRMLQPIASPGCLFYIYGTRYDLFDLYGHLLDLKEQGLLGLKVIHRAIKEDDKFIYSYYNEQRFQEKINAMNSPWVVQCQYWNDPNPEEDRLFKPPFPHYIKLPKGEYEWVCTVDPSFTISQQADNTGISVCAYPKDSKLTEGIQVFIELAIRAKLTIVQLFHKLYSLHARYHFDFLGVEKGAWQNALKDMFEYIVNQEGLKSLPIRDIQTPNVIDAKHQRIAAVAGYFEKGIASIRREKDTEGQNPFEFENGVLCKEMYYYGSNTRQKNDVLDSLSMQTLVHDWGIPLARPIAKQVRRREKWGDFFKIGSRREGRTSTWY